jgi:proteasome accessory factor C
MRLTPSEGFAVLAAGRTLLAVPGAEADGALASALAKLEAALGAGGGSVAVDLEAPPLLAEVRAAVAARQRLAVEYFSAWRDEVTSRVVDPYVVFSQEGRWYVAAADSLRGVVRHFRVDRFASVAPTGETFEVPTDAPVTPPERAFTGGPETAEVVVVVPSSARWVAEAYDPLDVEELADGRLRLRLTVAGERWLERLLLRVGPDAVVERPADLAGVGAAAAQRLLARY